MASCLHALHEIAFDFASIEPGRRICVRPGSMGCVTHYGWPTCPNRASPPTASGKRLPATGSSAASIQRLANVPIGILRRIPRVPSLLLESPPSFLVQPLKLARAPGFPPMSTFDINPVVLLIPVPKSAVRILVCSATLALPLISTFAKDPLVACVTS